MERFVAVLWEGMMVHNGKRIAEKPGGAEVPNAMGHAPSLLKPNTGAFRY